MSKIKKLIVGIIVTLIGIFGIYNVSNGYYIGQSIMITFSQYQSSNNIYCMEHGQSLTSDNYYKIISNVKIDGTKSTDHTGKTIDDKANAKFAYILNAKNTHYKRAVANAVWNYGSTWMNTVGKQHAGLYSGFASNVRGTSYKTAIEIEGDQYANSLVNEKTAPEDKTDKENLKVESYQKDDKQYIKIGAFKWDFGGKLTELKAYDQEGKEIPEILYSKYEGNTEKFISVEEIVSGKDFYISIPADKGVTRITKLTGKENIDNITANIWFLESKAGYKQNLFICSTAKKPETIEMTFDYNIVLQGNLKVIKVNKDNETVKLAGVGFYIQNKNTGKYVKTSENNVVYVDNREDAEEFMTDNNGEIIVKNLLVGTYVAYETKNPNYGYEIISEGKEKQIVIDKTAELKIPNKQKYIKLSGYVWVDKISGKQSLRNDLYYDGEYDENDILLDGIIVKLKNKMTGEVVKESKTANGGAYQFEDVLVDDLDKYYIEFEYDGLTYTNVIAHTDKNNGSKSAENGQTRTEFNNNFSVVEGKTQNTSITRDTNGNEKHTITYNIENHAATVDKTKSYYKITANTDETGYKIIDHFTYGQEEIKYINLGLYEREMPDIAIMKDLHDVKMTINGKSHVYEYAQRYLNAGEYGNGFNVGVKFGEKYGNMSYSRAVYKEDYIYESEEKNRELKVYVTYQIKMKNQSSEIITKINNIIDYYDARYNLVKIGTGINEGNITGDISLPESSSYNEKYKKSIINVNAEIGAQEEKDVYVQFELNREAVINVLNDKVNLDNVVEINSYSVYDKERKIYAGIDKDSNPGNAVPGDKATYEDDTDSAPGLKLEVSEHSREISGKVFLDSTSNELMTGKVRQGSGEYEDGEKGIEGVKVILTENSGTGKKYETTTDANGEFNINAFIPGDYVLTYTWGDSTYTVHNYKATIWTNDNRTEKQANGTSWYKKNMERKYSDAMDDYKTRISIDEMKDGKYVNNIEKMNSTTPEMNIEIEITDTTTTTFDDKFIPEGYNVRNVDFGIVERARQELVLGKRIKKFKVSLANDQVIADVTVNEDGSLSGQTNHMTYMKPSDKTVPNNGFIRLEMDNELIQGAKVEVTYEIKVTNESELEYLSENFYKYGIEEGEIVKITPLQVIDYLDGSWGFETDKNSKWTVNTLDEIKDKVDKVVYENEYSTISDKIILSTESFNTQLKPMDSISEDMNVSKKLANSDEISLDNEAEVVKVEKNGGSNLDSTPGNYVPGIGHQENDDSMAETLIITPNTGNDLNFVTPVIVGVVALIILGTGIILIKKKTL